MLGIQEMHGGLGLCASSMLLYRFMWRTGSQWSLARCGDIVSLEYFGMFKLKNFEFCNILLWGIVKDEIAVVESEVGFRQKPW